MDDPTDRSVFELRRLADYSEESILAELQRVAALIPDGAITATMLRGRSRVSMSAIRRRFKTLGDALRAAGLGHRSSEKIKTRGAHASTRMSNDEVLISLKELARRLNKDLLTVRDVEEHLPFARETLKKRWGTSRAAFEAAGIGTTNLGRRYTDEECFDNLLSVWTHYGRPPMYREMGLPPSQVGGKAYMRRFGSWSKALATFVERVNNEPDQPTPDTSDGSASTALEVVRSSEDKREISIGLRFRILHRDRFKCVLCGDNPARSLECNLHVDHIVPWSRGGKTREDNLRSLCATCNVGRGNRFTD